MSDKVLVIAEAGVNHNGNMDCAKRLVDVAGECGADAVKFQTFVSENCISRWADKAAYQKNTTGETENQLAMVKKLELTFAQFTELKSYCESKKIIFLSTPFDIESADFLYQLGLDIFKIPSGEITNYPLLKRIGQFGKKVIMSTGMCTLPEIRAAVELLKGQGTESISLLHCNTQYPTPMEDVNLRAMLRMQDEFGLPVGYSDHTNGIEVPIAAAALGASVIEKHFTLSREMEGPDHRASLEPDELKKMTESIRNIEKALGVQEKLVTDSERENLAVVRKSIVAAVPIKCGEVFTESNITTKRPGTGISPMRWNEMLGTIADRDFEEDELICL